MSIFLRLTQQPAREPFLLCLALIGLGLGIGALAGSSFYRKGMPGGIKLTLAILLSQSVAMFFLPLVQGANFLPFLLPASAAPAGEIIGDARGLIFSLPVSAGILFALLPRNRSGRRLGVLSFSLSALMTAIFLLTALSRGERITALFYGCSLLLGLLSLLSALQNRAKDG